MRAFYFTISLYTFSDNAHVAWEEISAMCSKQPLSTYHADILTQIEMGGDGKI